MSGADRRLDRVMTVLSGRERAVVYLQEYKEQGNKDPNRVSWSAGQDAERREYNRLIDVIRLCNGELADIVLVIRAQVTQEELRMSYLQTMRITASDLWIIGEYLKHCVKEPVTESEQKARNVPVSGFDVYADEDADEVELLRKNRQLIDKLTGRGTRLKLPLDLEGEIFLDPKGVVETARLLAVIVRDNLASYWTQLQAVSTVIEEYRDEFNGEDPLRPNLREYLDDALARIVVVKDQLIEYIGAWELPADHSRPLEMTRKLVERVLG